MMTLRLKGTKLNVSKLVCLTRLQLASTSRVKRKPEVVRLSPQRTRVEASASQGTAPRSKDIWQDICQGSFQTVDTRKNKRNPTADYEQAKEAGGLWRRPESLQANLKSLQGAKPGPSRATWASGVASSKTKARVDSLWRNYFQDPIQWWDNRENKLNCKSPDFRHKRTKEALWIDDSCTPQWVTEAMKAKALYMKPGRGDLKSPKHAVILRSSECSWTAQILQRTKSGQARQAVQIYEKMAEEGVEPSSHTFVALLKACSSLQDLDSAKRIHAHVVRSGCESDIYVGNMLVDVYAKCRSLVEARHVFEKMPHRNMVTWTAMILGYAQKDKGDEALQLYTRMQREGVVPDGRTYVAALKACSTLAETGERNGGDGVAVKERCLETVRTIHRDILKAKFESGVIVGTMLVDAYAKCGSLVDARQVFEKMHSRDAVSWNAMIWGCAQMDKGEEALQLYSRMQQEGVVPNHRTYVSALKACSSIAASDNKNGGDRMPGKEKCLRKVRAIHVNIRKSNFGSDVFVGNMLVDAYAKCGHLEDARHVFEEMPARTAVSWNAMILGYAQISNGAEALHMYSRMQQEGVIPDSWTYVSVLKACITMAESGGRNEDNDSAVKHRCLEIVRGIHRCIVEEQFELDGFVGNMLVDAYAKCGSLEQARTVFDKMPHRDVICWTAMILGYVQMNKGVEAWQLYTLMRQEGVVPDGRTYVSALKACTTMAESGERNGDDGIAVKERCLENVRDIHRHIMKWNIELDAFVGNMLVDAYAKCGSLEEARNVFEKMVRHDVVSWTAMIMAYAQVDKGEEALRLYNRMQLEGVVPDRRTYVGALNACGSVAALEKGKEIHAQISKAGLEAVDPFVTGSLINMYGKCGSMVDAREVFDELPRKDVVAWSALIAGYAYQGESDVVFDFFQRMIQEGIQPNGITFLGVLTVCSHVGLVDKGQEYFSAMSRDFGINPTIEHFTCMIDLFGRAGQVDKAMDMVKTMPFQPSSAMWRCMLAACRKWGAGALGREAFECAVRSNKADAAVCVLMANIYAAAGMHQEAKEIQAMRKQSRIWKQPGQSRWTDTRGIPHVFVVGDKGHPEGQDIYGKLGDLLIKMKKAGYVPHLDSVLRDIPDDEKEDALCGHSEKLAIAYALLKTPEGTTIRVVKNLRVCEDCHRAIAIMSRIEQRTLICRDAVRFHVFKEGKCSCGDYW